MTDTAQQQANNAERDRKFTSIARKMFYGGCFFLPWLWIVNVIYFRHAFINPAAPRALKSYLWKSLIGTLLMTVVFVAWVAMFQKNWEKWDFGRDLLVIKPTADTRWWIR